MRIATWNVNSIRQREKHVARWLEQCQPDVLLLQEIKCEAPAFPALTYHGLGYKAGCGPEGLQWRRSAGPRTVHGHAPGLAGSGLG